VKTLVTELKHDYWLMCLQQMHNYCYATLSF